MVISYSRWGETDKSYNAHNVVISGSTPVTAINVMEERFKHVDSGLRCLVAHFKVEGGLQLPQCIWCENCGWIRYDDFLTTECERKFENNEKKA